MNFKKYKFLNILDQKELKWENSSINEYHHIILYKYYLIHLQVMLQHMEELFILIAAHLISMII